MRITILAGGRSIMQQTAPILVNDLFPQEREHLLKLFAELTDEDWQKPTICQEWTVKDIALHLLGDDIGYLSGARDHFSNPFFRGKDLQNWESLVKNINEANELWVKATVRISPKLLTDLLELTGKQFYDYIRSLDPMAINGVVSWAGPDRAPVWLDIAREYTERWIHQQQIRDAVNKPGLQERRFLHPVIDTFVRALPHTYRATPATDETVLKFVVTGEVGDLWYLVRDANKWLLAKEVEAQPATIVTMDSETCWRLFTKGISRDQALAKTTIAGDQILGEKLLETVSIIA